MTDTAQPDDNPPNPIGNDQRAADRRAERDRQHALVRAAIDIIDYPDAPSPATAAGTLVLLRDGSNGLEVLMIHRGAQTTFGDMWAFPGGAVEPFDIPDGSGRDPIAALRRAAVRETSEEIDLIVDEGSLVYWSHWLPPRNAPRRFSTWFFVAAADGRHRDADVAVDGNEVNAHRWLTPSAALGLHTTGEMLLAPPTLVTLEQLFRYGDAQSAIDAANPERFASLMCTDANGVVVCVWHGDIAYDGAPLDSPGPRHRLEMPTEGAWRYFNTR